MPRGNLGPELSGPLLKGRLLWKTEWIIQTIVRECIDKSLGVTITADLPIHPCRIAAMYTCSPISSCLPGYSPMVGVSPPGSVHPDSSERPQDAARKRPDDISKQGLDPSWQ